jgi:hypothetical protein
MIGSPRATRDAVDLEWDLALAALTGGHGRTWDATMEEALKTLCAVALVSRGFRGFALGDRSTVGVLYRRCVDLAQHYKRETLVEGYGIARAVAGGLWDIAHVSRAAPLRAAAQLLWGAGRGGGRTVWRPPCALRATMHLTEHRSTATKAGFAALREFLERLAAHDFRDWRLRICMSSDVPLGYARSSEIVREVILVVAPSRIELQSALRPPAPPSAENPIPASLYAFRISRYELLRTERATTLSRAVASLVQKPLVFIVKYQASGRRRVEVWRVGPGGVHERRVVHGRRTARAPE